MITAHHSIMSHAYVSSCWQTSCCIHMHEFHNVRSVGVWRSCSLGICIHTCACMHMWIEHMHTCPCRAQSIYALLACTHVIPQTLFCPSKQTHVSTALNINVVHVVASPAVHFHRAVLAILIVFRNVGAKNVPINWHALRRPQGSTRTLLGVRFITIQGT
jgi:hypothetical protein